MIKCAMCGEEIKVDYVWRVRIGSDDPRVCGQCYILTAILGELKTISSNTSIDYLLDPNKSNKPGSIVPIKKN